MESGNRIKMGEEMKETGRRIRKALDLSPDNDSAKWNHHAVTIRIFLKNSSGIECKRQSRTRMEELFRTSKKFSWCTSWKRLEVLEHLMNLCSRKQRDHVLTLRSSHEMSDTA